MPLSNLTPLLSHKPRRAIRRIRAGSVPVPCPFRAGLTRTEPKRERLLNTKTRTLRYRSREPEGATNPRAIGRQGSLRSPPVCQSVAASAPPRSAPPPGRRRPRLRLGRLGCRTDGGGLGFASVGSVGRRQPRLRLQMLAKVLPKAIPNATPSNQSNTSLEVKLYEGFSLPKCHVR